MFIGWSSLLLRLGYGVIFGLFSLQRMDISSLPRHVETWDAAYRAYIGYMMIDMLHSNPILKSFVEILNQTQKNKEDIEPKKKSARIRYIFTSYIYNRLNI
jgi:hypothetical protein